MENGFYSSMALANTRLKEKRSGNVSISYTQTLQSLLNLFNEEQIVLCKVFFYNIDHRIYYRISSVWKL